MLTEKDIAEVTEIAALLLEVKSAEARSKVKGYLMAMKDVQEAQQQKQTEQKEAQPA